MIVGLQMFIYGLTFGHTCNSYIVDVLPDFANGYVYIFFWFFNIIITYFFTKLSMLVIFLIFFTSSIVGLLFFLFYIIETKGKSHY